MAVNWRLKGRDTPKAVVQEHNEAVLAQLGPFVAVIAVEGLMQNGSAPRRAQKRNWKQRFYGLKLPRSKKAAYGWTMPGYPDYKGIEERPRRIGPAI